MRGPTEIRTMSWGKIKLSVMCEDWEKVEVFFQKLKLDYCGQGLAGGTFEALQCLTKRNNARTSFTGQEKAKVLEAFDYRCAFCGSKSKRLEFDHVVRVSESFGGAPQTQPHVLQLSFAQDLERVSQHGRVYLRLQSE